MSRRHNNILCIALLIALPLTGCSNSLKEENLRLSQEVAALKEKNISLENTIFDLNKKVEDQQYFLELSSEHAFNGENIYPIYTADMYSYKVEKDAYVYISEDTSIRQKLDTLAGVLSEAYFSGLPIEVVKIETVDKKKIAIINLKEAAENQGKTDPKDTKGKTWVFHYMQGSTGGTITQTELIETMLQREYKGQWVDGVKFLYQGDTCAYEHAYSLKDINYRD